MSFMPKVSMRAKDEQLWSAQTMELRAEETGQRFLAFFEFWFTTADRLIDERQRAIDWCDDNRQPATTVPISPAGAMRLALQIAEREMGFLTVDWTGQMLAVAAQHWAHGDEMMAGLSVIEHRVVEEALARKIAQLAEDAKLDVSQPKQ